MSHGQQRTILRSNTAVASVVGLVEESIYTQVLEIHENKQQQQQDSHGHGHGHAVSSFPLHGGMNMDTSGLAFILSKRGGNVNGHGSYDGDDGDDGDGMNMKIWHQGGACLPSEEVIPASRPVVTLSHPQYQNITVHDDVDANIQHDKCVLMTPSYGYGGGYGNGNMSGNGIGNQLDALTGMSLYWTSPNGVICYWNDIGNCIIVQPSQQTQKPKFGSSQFHQHAQSQSTSTPSGNSTAACDASLQIPLLEHEYVACTTSASSLDGEMVSCVLVSTSLNRTFAIRKNARPLELQCTLVVAEDNRDRYGFDTQNTGKQLKYGGVEEDSTAGGGYLTGLVRGLFTPSKPRRPVQEEEDSDGDNDDDNEMEEGEEGSKAVVGVFALSLPRYGYAGNGTDSNGNENGNILSSPIPGSAKSMKLSHTGNSETKGGLIYTVTSGGNVDVWSNPTTSSNVTGDGHGYGKHLQRVNCTKIAKKFLNASARTNNNDVKVVSASAMNAAIDLDSAEDLNVASLVICMNVKVQVKNGSVEDRLYLVQFPICMPNRNRNRGRNGNDFRCGLVNTKRASCQWLDRYSSQAIASTTNPLVCAGLVAVACQSDGSDGTHDGVDTIAYCAMQQLHQYNQQLPVTVTAVRFLSGNNNTSNVTSSIDTCSQVLDVDMPEKIAHVVAGTMQYDPSTDGCTIMCNNGLITNVRMTFPPPLPSVTEHAAQSKSANLDRRSVSTQPSTGKIQREKVESLAGHVHSAFRTHVLKKEQNKSSVSGGTGSPMKLFSPNGSRRGGMDAFLPQAIVAAHAETLSAAVVFVSAQLANEASVMGEGGGVGAANSSIQVIQEKLDMHCTFVDYIRFSGIYKRVNVAGKISLRDHGEMLYAVGSALMEWAQMLETDASVNAMTDMVVGGANSNYKAEKNLIGYAMRGLEENITNFPRHLYNIVTRAVPSPDNDDGDEGKSGGDASPWALLAAMKITLVGANSAKMYRAERSEELYDIAADPDNDIVEGAQEPLYYAHGSYPWTSGPTYLAAMEHVLASLRDAVESDDLLIFLQERCDNFSNFVYELSVHLLEGYRNINITSSSRSPGRKEDKYDFAKQVVFHLVHLLCTGESGEDNVAAYELSLRHNYFEGVLHICHSHSSNGIYDPSYDLVKLLTDVANPLHQSVDYQTGLPFQKFALHWFCDRGLLGTVLEIGQHCSETLSSYLEEDERLAHLRWVQNIKTGQFGKASTNLVGLSLDGISSLSEDSPSLEGKQLVMSLAKLSAMCCNESSQQRDVITFADKRLRLCKAQDILADMVNTRDVRAENMDAIGLMELSLDLAKNKKDQGSKINACLTGLEIAKCIQSDDSIINSSRLSDTAKVWAVSIMADFDALNGILEEYNMLSEADRLERLRGTTFFNLANEYYSTVATGAPNEVGFDLVTDEVMRLLDIQEKAFPAMLTASLGLFGSSASQ
uniref:Nucleoporin Nup133/Nup155-like C-terminal domain-containing protein n=1 Tax=Chaetoceros debilis TaxID=122233 RepID=A0A7S3VB51_9STRA